MRELDQSFTVFELLVIRIYAVYTSNCFAVFAPCVPSRHFYRLREISK